MHSNKKSLLSIPNTDISKLHHIVENYSDREAPNLILHSTFNKGVKLGSSAINNIGIMIAEPSQRLFSAYQAIKKSRPEENVSFREFYSSPVRRNLYSKILSGINLDDIGFIGVRNSFSKSVLMMSDWLHCRLYRLPHNLIGEQSEYSRIPSDAQAEIESLHAKDYELYRKVISTFEQRWEKYQERFCFYCDTQKKIKIHVGPPKTGTSAIQAWLNKNYEELVSEGVFYPNHSSDRNGVSSGNFERLISIEQSNIGANDKSKSSSYFDDEKARALLKDFRESSCDTLLLSSEHFFYYLIWLFSRFAGAEFIFYVRNPLAIVESSFHQEVKRHNRTNAFFIPKSLGFNNLEFIKQLEKEFGVYVTYRYFDNHQFVDGNLLSDFSSTVGLQLPTPKNAVRLNTQYSPGAITLMLKCNAFASEKVRKELDMFLQRDSESVPAFSFIEPMEFAEIQTKIMHQANILANCGDGLSKSAMSSLVLHYKKPPTVTESECNRDFLRVIGTITKTQRSLARRLRKECRKSLHIDGAFEIYQHLKLDWSSRFRECITRIFSKSH